MAFVAEDGTGVANANSYVSVADADAFLHDLDDATWPAKSAEEKQAALIKATAYIEGTYRGTWIGKIKSTAQGLAWPRGGAYDPDGRELTGVPKQVKDVVCRLALESFDGDPDATLDRKIQSETIGPISTTYEAGSPAGKTYRFVDILLNGLTNKSRFSIPLLRV